MMASVAEFAGVPPLRGELLRDVPMARFTSWRVGGPADELYRPVDVADLGHYLAALPDRAPDPVWVGLGSNLLVRDGGIRGSVVCLSKSLQGIRRVAPDRLRVEAGATCARVARRGAKEGLAGGEFLAGIPGTLGGALAMNAGAFGGQTWDLVRAVEVINRNGRRETRRPPAYRIAYREVVGPPREWFTAAELQLLPGESGQIRDGMRKVLRQRRASQPLDMPSAGSVFRNPPGDYAARLIEQCGLKGTRRGDAVVSGRHANFIVNLGSATARDIEALIGHVAAVVLEATGVLLQPEVHIVGEPA